MTPKTFSGRLEDLELAEVCRVIGLSRRSGTLVVSWGANTAELRFAGGRLESARSTVATETLAGVLVDAGALLPADLGVPPDRTIDDVLRQVGATRPEAKVFARAEQAIRQALENVLLVILALDEGEFTFQREEGLPSVLRFPGDTTYAVSEAIDAEQFLREAKKRHRAKAPRVVMPRPAPTDEEPADATIAVVDDDPRFLTQVERDARVVGVDVETCADARAGLDVMKRMKDEPHLYALVDLVMARPNGKGILGGLKLLEEAAKDGFADRVFLVLDGPHDDAAAIAAKLGAGGVVQKPPAGDALAPLLNPVLERLGIPPLVDRPIDLVAELRLELGESLVEWGNEPELRLDDQQKALEVLRSLLAQVNDPTFEEEIPLLLLRFASAFFARGALFGAHARTGMLVGLGGFGFSSQDPGRAIHALRIPMAADSIFSRSMREKTGVRQPFFESEHNARLVETLGGPRAREAYTAPLLSPRGLEAVLYADNATTGRAFPDTALLEIFVQQAGAALERSSLVRKIEELVRGGKNTRAA